MNEMLTQAEIAARFPDEWVFIIDTDVGPDHFVRSGVVTAHARDREEVERTAMVPISLHRRLVQPRSHTGR